MDSKYIIFFIVAVLVLTYFVIFWQNRHKKVKFQLFNQEIEINLGLLTFGIFLDGIILASILLWLIFFR